jgi:hypothetical protein
MIYVEPVAMRYHHGKPVTWGSVIHKALHASMKPEGQNGRAGQNKTSERKRKRKMEIRKYRFLESVVAVVGVVTAPTEYSSGLA